MAKNRIKITDTSIKALAPGDIAWDTQVSGLMARMAKSGVVTFSFNYRDRRTGKMVRRKIGSSDAIKAADARRLAEGMRARAQTGEGQVAINETPAQRGALTLRAAIGIWLDGVQRDLSAATFKMYSGNMNRHVLNRRIADLPLDSITRADLMACIDGAARVSDATRANTYKALSAFLGWADVREMTTVTLPKQARVVKAVPPRDKLMTDERLAHAWAAADMFSPKTRDLWRLVLATGLRSGAAHSVRGEDITITNTGGAVILIRGSEMKGKQDFEVTLTPWVMNHLPLLRDAEPGLIFGKTRWRATDALRRYRDAFGVEDVRLHDVRRSLRTFAAKRGFGRDAGEAALSHTVITSQIEKVYNLTNYDRAGWPVLTGWQEHLRCLIEPAQDNVIDLNEASK